MHATYTRWVQRTLREAVAYSSPVADGQRRAAMLIRPAGPDTGICLVRCDAPGGSRTLHARLEYLGTDGSSATLECPSGVGVRAVGLLLAGLAACGIDNAEVTLDGPEAVLPDGGIAALVGALQSAGTEGQARPLRVMKIERVISVASGRSRAMLRPSTVPHAAISLDADDGDGRHRWLAVGLGEEALRREFVTLAGGRQTESEALRRRLVDCFGYLAAAGAPILGHFLAQNPDHELMHALVRSILGQQGSWSLVEAAACAV